MFIRTGKYLYTEMSELQERFKIFTKTFVCHFALMSMLHSSMIYMMMNYDDNTALANIFVAKEIAYSVGMYSYLITIFSTSLKMPFFAFIIEIFLIADVAIPLRPVIRKSTFPLVLSSFAFIVSFYLEYKSDCNFIKYMQNTYSGFTPQIDTLTDTSYSILMFACFYSSVLNYYRIW
ncbi:hypothetical protein ECANGB1_614 [Enterospora canceri]|uniref:Uncharacterized protein n=1 Tax=Enterospora canceri TaxID=1081671 RepID=A0A1Y1S7W5_9MICR|nr:hypothetical protein ECANGB1_614 [Enterospora canceri]